MQRRSKFHIMGQAMAALTLALGASGAAFAASGVLPVHSDRPSAIDSGAATPTTPLDASTPIGMTITLPLTNKADLDKFVADVSNPRSPLYGHYLKPAEFAAKYGASQSDFNAVLAWAKSSGLTVTQTSLSRNSISIKGTAGQLQSALNVQFLNYVDSKNNPFFSASTSPELPSSFASAISSVYGMSNYVRPIPDHVIVTPAMRAQMKAQRAAAQSAKMLGGGSSFLDGIVGAPIQDTGGTGHGGDFSPSDLNIAYFMPDFPDAGKGTTLGVYAEGAYYTGDPAVYEQYYGLPSTPVTPESVAGTDTTTPTPGVALEASLDIDMELAMAPHLKGITVYEAGTEPSFSGSLIDALTAVANDDTVSTLDISYGTDELVQESDSATALADENTAFEQLAAEGINATVSAGDQGAYGRLVLAGYIPPSDNAEDPASQPLVTAVGGTTMFLFDQENYLETVWDELGANDSATGGGVSSYWSIPSYQLDSTGLSVAVANGGSPTMRNVPDVAAVADPYTPVDVYTSDEGYGWIGIGGTSASAPIWAGYFGVVNQNRKDVGLPNIGFANPLLYALGQSIEKFQYHDVLDGTNGNPNLFGGVGGYFAGFGYDNTTGWGTLYGSILMSNLVAVPKSISNVNGNAPAAPTGFTLTGATSDSLSFSWTPVSGATGYVLKFVYPSGATSHPTDYYEIAKSTVYTTATIGALPANASFTVELLSVNHSGATADQTLLSVATTGS